MSFLSKLTSLLTPALMGQYVFAFQLTPLLIVYKALSLQTPTEEVGYKTMLQYNFDNFL